MAAEMVVRRMKTQNATIHGLRSSFRDWAGNETGHPRELIERALAHVIGDKAEQANSRDDAAPFMEAWAGHCDPSRLANVGKTRRR
jgi:hypothetical protein